MASIFASVNKDLGANARDLTGLVKQVKDILPQHSDDVICEALIQNDEDVMRAVDLLLSSAFASKAQKKRDRHREQQPPQNRQVCEEPVAAPQEPIEEIEKEERPKTAAEKLAAKLRKKLREIERIEERVRRGEKVDPLQMPKISKKSEVQYELFEADHLVQEEERAREEERRQEQLAKEAAEEAEREAEAQRAAEAAEAARVEREERERREAEEHAAREREAERQRALQAQAMEQMLQAQPRHPPNANIAAASHSNLSHPPQFPPQQMRPPAQNARTNQQQTALAQPPTQLPKAPPQQPPLAAAQQKAPLQQNSGAPGDQQAMGMQLLSMLHANKGQVSMEQGYQQSRQVANELSGGRGPLITNQNTSSQTTKIKEDPWDATWTKEDTWDNTWTNNSKNTQKQEWHHQSRDEAQPVSEQQPWYQKQPADKEWATEGWGAPDGQESNSYGSKPRADDFTNQYSTPLDISQISEEKRAEAERIANEIEGHTSRSRGKGEWDDSKGGRRGAGVNNQTKGNSSKGSGRGSTEGKGKGKGKTDSSPRQERVVGGQAPKARAQALPPPGASLQTNMTSSRLNW